MGTDLEAALEITDGGEDESTEEIGTTDDTGTEGDSGDSTDNDSSGDDSDASTVDGESSDSTEDGDSAPTDDSGNTEPSEFTKLKEDQEELRQMLRVTRRENATLRAKVGRIDSDVQLEDDLDEGEGGEGTKLTHVEELQNHLSNIAQSRAGQLELYVEQMAEMTKYSDVADVCSKVNMDTIVETAAETIVAEQGGNIDEIMLELEVDIWSKPNPYKYLYQVIKAHHPKYATATTQKKEDSQSLVDNAKDNKTASSIQDMGGSGGGKGGGWTADRIDRLPEDEINKVPVDVYEKYMQGTLK